MKRAIFLLVILVLILAGCGGDKEKDKAEDTPEGQAASEQYTGKKIVWLDSYSPGYVGADARQEGIENVLAGTGVELLSLHLDSLNITEEDALQAKAEELHTQIDEFGPDVIIATDDSVQKYVIVPFYKDTDVPVIFSGVNQDAKPYGYPTTNITGMVEVDLIKQLVSQLENYTPGTTIAFLGDDTTSTHRSAEVYAEYYPEMSMVFTNSYAEYKQAFLDLQTESDVLIVYNNAGVEDWDEADAAVFFVENTSVPTGAVLDWMSPYVLEVLAKVLVEHGEWPAQMALQVLDGTPISDIPVTENQQGEIYLNLDIAEQLEIAFTPNMLRNAITVGGDAEE